MSDNSPTSDNLLENPGFEADWSEESSHRVIMFNRVTGEATDTVASNVFAFPKWIVWSRIGGEYNLVEVKDAHKSVDAVRVHSGEKAAQFFKTDGIIDCGLMQRVYVGKGSTVRGGVFGQCWSMVREVKDSHPECYGNAHCSAGVGMGGHLLFDEDIPPLNGDPWNDAIGNEFMLVGIDPYGRLDPYAEGVVWGKRAYSYNEHHKLPPVECKSQSDYATFIVRAKNKWRSRNCDAYIDDAELVIVGESPPPSEDEVELQVDPINPRVGDTVTATATSKSDLENVRFTVTFDDTDYLFGVLAESEQGGVHTWTMEFTVNDEGLHRVTVDSDTCSDTLSFTVRPAEPKRGDPRIQYARTYLLLPPDADMEWALAAVRGAWDVARITIGGSADDGGIGNLNARKVIAVNPHWWKDNLGAFFERYYLGVEYVQVTANTPSELETKLKAMYPEPTLPQVGTLIGLNDPDNRGAGQWMLQENIKGILYVPVILNFTEKRLDFSQYANAGIEVYVNLRYDWASADGHQGTLPLYADQHLFEQACVQTIRDSSGVHGWSLTNEANSPREWSKKPDGSVEAVTVARLATFFDRVAEQVPDGTRLSIGGFDPFNVQSGMDPREWTRLTWQYMERQPSFVDVHGYIRGPDVNLVGSLDKFPPGQLEWQYLNYPGCFTTLLEVLPTWAKELPIVVSEFNHLYRTVEGDNGWVNDERAADVVGAAVSLAGGLGLHGLVIYRWVGDDWSMKDNEFVKQAIKDRCNGA